MKTVLPERERPVTPRRKVGWVRPVAKSTSPPAANLVSSIISLNFKSHLSRLHNWGESAGKQGEYVGGSNHNCRLRALIRLSAPERFASKPRIPFAKWQTERRRIIVECLLPRDLAWEKVPEGRMRAPWLRRSFCYHKEEE